MKGGLEMWTDCHSIPRKFIRTFLILVTVAILLVIILAVRSSIRPDAGYAAENKPADSKQSSSDPNKPDEDSKKTEERTKAKKSPRPDHSHAAFQQRNLERTKMVRRQIRGRGVRDPNVLASLETVPRHAFVRPRDFDRAYADRPLPIGLGQTISQPYIVAYMTEALNLEPNDKVLEIGTGSGYQAAVCAEIAQKVYTIEIVKELAESAKQRLQTLGYKNVSVRAGDGYSGWKENAPFDAIIITAAAPLVPPPLIEQLKPNGKMILPLGSPFGEQRLVLITKDDQGKIRSRSLFFVRFVPMIGRVTEPQRPPEQ